MANILERALIKLTGGREEDLDKEEAERKKKEEETKVDPSVDQAVKSIKKRHKMISDI